MTFLRSVIGVDSVSCAVLVAGILATQGIYRRMAQTWEIELPFQTALALGPILPSILGLLLLVTIAVRVSVISEQGKAIWRLVLMVLLPGTAAWYAVALWLPFAGGPERLT